MTVKSFLDRFSGLYGIHRMFFMSFPIFSSTSFLIKLLSYVIYDITLITLLLRPLIFEIVLVV